MESKPKPLAKTTRRVEETKSPTLAKCGKRSMWYLRPRRHWHQLTDAEIALNILAGNPVIIERRFTKHAETMFKRAWQYGDVMIKGQDGSFFAVRLNSQCGHKKRRASAGNSGSV